MIKCKNSYYLWGFLRFIEYINPRRFIQEHCSLNGKTREHIKVPFVNESTKLMPNCTGLYGSTKSVYTMSIMIYTRTFPNNREFCILYTINI